MIRTLNDRAALERAVRGALRSCINDHGPITAALVTSATKRVVGNLLNLSQAETNTRRLNRVFPVITGPAE